MTLSSLLNFNLYWPSDSKSEKAFSSLNVDLGQTVHLVDVAWAYDFPCSLDFQASFLHFCWTIVAYFLKYDLVVGNCNMLSSYPHRNFHTAA